MLLLLLPPLLPPLLLPLLPPLLPPLPLPHRPKHEYGCCCYCYCLQASTPFQTWINTAYSQYLQGELLLPAYRQQYQQQGEQQQQLQPGCYSQGYMQQGGALGFSPSPSVMEGGGAVAGMAGGLGGEVGMVSYGGAEMRSMRQSEEAAGTVMERGVCVGGGGGGRRVAGEGGGARCVRGGEVAALNTCLPACLPCTTPCR